MRKIIVLGSINMDVVVRVPGFPDPGETLFGSDLRFIPGGKGSNQAVAAARLTAGVFLAGKLGQDAFGSALYEFLKGENLNLDHVVFSENAPSGTALITVDKNGENHIIVISGSNMTVEPEDIASLPLSEGDILVSVFEMPQKIIKTAFTKAKKAGVLTLLNPAPAAGFIDGLQDLCDILIVNETELSFYAGQPVDAEDQASIRQQAQSMRSRPDQTIIVTLGRAGAACLQDRDFFVAPGWAVQVVDTTAAGDCFVGGLAAALKEGHTLRQAVEFANAAASLAVQKLGASASLPERRDVDKVYQTG